MLVNQVHNNLADFDTINWFCTALNDDKMRIVVSLYFSISVAVTNNIQSNDARVPSLRTTEALLCLNFVLVELFSVKYDCMLE